jgi:hypothetical protein
VDHSIVVNNTDSLGADDLFNFGGAVILNNSTVGVFGP